MVNDLSDPAKYRTAVLCLIMQVPLLMSPVGLTGNLGKYEENKNK